jgi:hypothetical protein
MKFFYIMATIFAVSTTAMAQQTNAVEKTKMFNFTASTELASAYLYRGATFNDGWVFQPRVEIGIGFITLGAWANFDINDYAGAIEGEKLSEKNLYVLCNYNIGKLYMQAGYKSYMDKYIYVESEKPEFKTKQEAEDYQALMTAKTLAYPKPDLAKDDAAEVSLSLMYKARFSPSISVYQGIDGCLDKTTYIVAGLSHEYYRQGDWSMSISAAVSYIEQENNLNGFSHYLLTHDLTYKSITATIGYIRPLDRDILVEASEGGPLDIREYGSVGFSWHF